GNPQQKEYKEKGVIDSGYSKHMTGNKCYLTEYEDYDGGFVSFRDGKGRITGKGKIKTGALDFDDVPTNVKSLMKKSYCLVVTDDFSRFSWVFFFATKDETSGILKTFITGIENQLEHKVKFIRYDNGTEFKNSIMNQFCELKGIKREFSVARTPQQNCVAKRKNKTLIEAARTMIVDSKFPTIFWAEVVNTACYVLNRVLIIKPYNKTPSELIRRRPPLIDFMKPFGCPITILNTRDHLGKFDGKADEGYFVGYSVVSKAMRVFNKRTRIVEETLNIRFLENTSNVKGNGPDWLFDVDSLTISINYVLVVAENQTNGIAGNKDNIVAGQVQKDKEPAQEYILIPLCTPDSSISQDSKDRNVDAENKANDVDENNVPSSPINTVEPSVSTANAFEEHLFERFSPFKNASVLPHIPNVSPIQDTRIFGNAYDDEDVEEEVDMNNVASSYTVPDGNSTKFLKDHLQEQVIGSLKTPVQTRQMTKMNEEHGLISSEELLQFKLLNVWTLVDLPRDKWAIEEGIDYDEVFAPVSRIKAIRLFLAYASFKDFVVYQMDVKSVFLYGKIEEEVCVCQPYGFEDPDFPNKVYKVEKALYGLHQALRAWYETLPTYLLDNGFHRGQIHKTLFIKRHKDDILLVQVYVDDIIFRSTKKDVTPPFLQYSSGS
ncbi:putative ribonuclease H-like domain-containing protein, partial [Tanacetum coccineum]